MASTYSTADAVLKDVYGPDVNEQLNQTFFLLHQIEKNRDDIEGRRVVHAIHVSRSSGVGAREDGDALPAAANQGFTPGYIPVRHVYGRIEISGPVMRAMRSNKGSFLRAVETEMKGITNDLKRDVNRQLWGTSDGVIATCGTTAASTTVQLATTTTATQYRQMGLRDGGGIKIDIGTAADPVAIATGRSITAYDFANSTITISGAAVTTSSSHRIYRSGSGGASSNSGMPGDGQAELTGLQTIVKASGVLHGVDPSTYDVWAAYVDSNGGTNRAISENLVDSAIMEAELRSDDQVDILACSYGVEKALNNLFKAQRRSTDTVELMGGFKGKAWSTDGEWDGAGKTRAWRREKDCPSNSMFGLCTDSLVWYEGSDWDWADEDGSVLNRVSGYDSYEAFLYKDAELACRRRNANFRISDLTEA